MSERNKAFCTTSNAITQPLGGAAGVGIAAGTNAIIPGVAGQTISILFVFAQAGSGASSLQMAAGSKPISDVIPLGLAAASPQGFIVDHHDNPIIIPAGQTFNLVTTGSTVSGYIMYTQGNA